MKPTVSRRPAAAWEVHASLFAAQTGFALFPTLGKIALTSLPPLPLAALRVASAALLLEAVRRISGAENLTRGDHRKVLVYGLLGVSLNQVLFILGLSMTTAINTTILTATIPIFTLGVAVVLKKEKLTVPAAAGVLLAGAGALILVNVEHFDWRSQYVRGDVLLLGNAIAYSLYLVFSRPILAHYNVLTVVSRVFLYGAPAILLFTAPALAHFTPSEVTARSWACLAGIVLFCTVIPYALNSWALAHTGASRVALYVFLQPLIATAMAIVVLGERPTVRTIVAGLLILSGLAVSVVRRRKIPAEEVA
ncbi:MAG TPA: DMT family transporter [Thermoanaerobaculia bacterium]|nr:DMT family transporter [Thermoanaerobaculia bacterium]